MDYEFDASAISARIFDAVADAGIPPTKVNSTLANVCGVSYQTVFHWFTGRTAVPRAEHLARIALAFDLDLNWLILGDHNRG